MIFFHLIFLLKQLNRKFRFCLCELEGKLGKLYFRVTSIVKLNQLQQIEFWRNQRGFISCHATESYCEVYVMGYRKFWQRSVHGTQTSWKMWVDNFTMFVEFGSPYLYLSLAIFPGTLKKLLWLYAVKANFVGVEKFANIFKVNWVNGMATVSTWKWKGLHRDASTLLNGYKDSYQRAIISVKMIQNSNQREIIASV